jgi:hypothetical protein
MKKIFILLTTLRALRDPAPSALALPSLIPHLADNVPVRQKLTVGGEASHVLECGAYLLDTEGGFTVGSSDVRAVDIGR